MEKLLDKSISQTDALIEITQEIILERDRLREINKELVEALMYCVDSHISQKGMVGAIANAQDVLAKAEKTA